MNPDGTSTHVTLAARHNDLTTALGQMRSALDDDGNIRDRTAYNEGRDEVSTSASELAETLLGMERNNATNDLARKTGNGIWAGSIIAGVGTVGTAVTGGMIAWNNLRQGHHLSSGGTTTNETNNGTNNITNGTNNNTNNNGGTSNTNSGS